MYFIKYTVFNIPWVNLPQENLKIFGYPTSGSGGKKTLKWFLKSENTDKHTDRQTYGHFDL